MALPGWRETQSQVGLAAPEPARPACSLAPGRGLTMAVRPPPRPRHLVGLALTGTSLGAKAVGEPGTGWRAGAALEAAAAVEAARVAEGGAAARRPGLAEEGMAAAATAAVMAAVAAALAVAATEEDWGWARMEVAIE